MSHTSVKVIDTHDGEYEARLEASRLWDQGRRVGVMRTVDWNQYHPQQLVRTVHRFVIYEEMRGGE